MDVKLSEMTIDVWMQHPTKRFLAHDMFDSLRRWTGEAIPEEPPPIDVTVAAMDAADVRFGLLSAWHGPGGPLIANDEVAAWIEQHPDRFAGLAAVDLNKPMEAVRELRRCVIELGFKGLRVIPWLWELPPTDRVERRLVDRDEQHVAARLEDVVRAIAVVDVPVEDRDALDTVSVPRVLRGDRHVVKEAEAHRTRDLAVMSRRPRADEAGGRLSGHQRVDQSARSARSRQRR